MDNLLGRLEPTTWRHVEKYPYSLLGITSMQPLEKTLELPPLIKYYNQIGSSCVGYSSSWMMSIYNTRGLYPFKYDALWLYRRAQEVDNNPNTNPQNDIGTYIWAAMDILRLEGHVRVATKGKMSVNPIEGIESNYWCINIDEMRTAFSLGRPIVIGVNWYENFNTPVKINGDYWIGRPGTNLGRILGGHAMCVFAGSDGKQGWRVASTWGDAYPNVWISYETMQKLLDENGEACVAFDRRHSNPYLPRDKRENKRS